MKKKIMLLLLVFVFITSSLTACSHPDKNNPDSAKPETDSKYELMFYDDFETLNNNYWKRSNGVRRGGYWHEDQVFVEDGNLVIRTEYKENGEYGPAYYTGAVETDALLNIPFGRYEIRFKTQRAKGYWNAIWLMQNGLYNKDNGARDGAEIDILEIPYLDDFQHMIHIDGYSNRKGTTVKMANVADTWHTIVMEWTTDRIVFFIDNMQTWEITSPNWISQVNDGNFIISCEINGKVVNNKPDPSKSEWFGVGNIESNGTDFRNDFLIDYVKVYKINNTGLKTNN